jgi:ribosomal protein S18 acetylase RimI-like enzyme
MAPTAGELRPTVRPATSEDIPGIARVHVDAWRSTYRGIIPQAFLDGLSYRDREALWRRVFSGSAGEHGVFVADAGPAGIVGFADGARGRTQDTAYEGELLAIYLLEDFQRRGLGRELTLQLVEWFVDHGIRSMLLWVLADNPACHFYEALGGTRLRAERIQIGGADLEEVAYGWTDITAIQRLPR